jgi:hypothetical protein
LNHASNERAAVEPVGRTLPERVTPLPLPESVIAVPLSPVRAPVTP